MEGYAAGHVESTEVLIHDWNLEVAVGDSVWYTEDHGKTWEESTAASKAFVRNGQAVLRVKGVAYAVRLLDVAPKSVG